MYLIHSAMHDFTTFVGVGVGATKQISPIPLFFDFFYFCQNTDYWLNIIFIFHMSRRSTAAVTLVKYETESKHLPGILTGSNVSDKQINERRFSNPTQLTILCASCGAHFPDLLYF